MKKSQSHITSAILVSLLFVVILISQGYEWWRAWLAAIIIGSLWLCINKLLAQSGVKVTKHKRERRLKPREISARMEELAKCLEDNRLPDAEIAVDTYQKVFDLIASDERLKGDFMYIWGDAWIRADQFINKEDGLDITIKNNVKVREELGQTAVLAFMSQLFSAPPIREVLIDVIRHGTDSIGTNDTLLAMNAHLAWMYTTEDLSSVFRGYIKDRSLLTELNQGIDNE